MVVDADASLLEVARLLLERRPSRVEPALEAVDVAGSPSARLTVSPVPAPLVVVVGVGDVPVSEVDDVQDTPSFLAFQAAADRPREEQTERALLERLGREVTNALAGLGLEPTLAEQHLPHHRLRERQPALRVEQEVVLEALRDQDVARLLGLRRLLGHGHLEPYNCLPQPLSSRRRCTPELIAECAVRRAGSLRRRRFCAPDAGRRTPCGHRRTQIALARLSRRPGPFHIPQRPRQPGRATTLRVTRACGREFRIWGGRPTPRGGTRGHVRPGRVGVGAAGREVPPCASKPPHTTG